MDKAEVLSYIRGLQKKHGSAFQLQLKYRTQTGKVRRRHGDFVALDGEETLRLVNRDKGSAEASFEVGRIVEVRKR